MKTVSHLGPLVGALALSLLGATRVSADLAVDFATRNALGQHEPAVLNALGRAPDTQEDAAPGALPRLAPGARLAADPVRAPFTAARTALPPASTVNVFATFAAQRSIPEPATYAALLATATILLALVRRRLGRT